MSKDEAAAPPPMSEERLAEIERTSWHRDDVWLRTAIADLLRDRDRLLRSAPAAGVVVPVPLHVIQTNFREFKLTWQQEDMPAVLAALKKDPAP